MKQPLLQLLRISLSQLEFRRIGELGDTGRSFHQYRCFRGSLSRLLCNLAQSRLLGHWLNGGSWPDELFRRLLLLLWWIRLIRGDRAKILLVMSSWLGSREGGRSLLWLNRRDLGLLEVLRILNRWLNRCGQIEVSKQVAEQIHITLSLLSRGSLSGRSMVLWRCVPWSLQLGRCGMPR